MQYLEISRHRSRVEIRMLGVGKSQVDRLEICEPKLNADFRFDRTQNRVRGVRSLRRVLLKIF